MQYTSLAVHLLGRDSPVPVSSKTPLFFTVINQTSLNYLLLVFLEQRKRELKTTTTTTKENKKSAGKFIVLSAVPDCL